MKRKNSPGCGCCKCPDGSTFISVTVTDFCTGDPVEGATVDFQAGSPLASVGTADTDSDGVTTIEVENPGSYTLLINKTDYYEQTINNVQVACNGTTEKTAVLSPSVGLVDLTVIGACGSPLFGGLAIPGATVVATQGGTEVETAVTGSDGIAHFTKIPLSISTTFTVNVPDYSTDVGVLSGIFSDRCTITQFGRVITLTLNVNHHCICTGNHTCIIGNQLDCTTPWGDSLLTWNSATGLWEGTLASLTLCDGASCNNMQNIKISYGYIATDSGCAWRLGWECEDDGRVTGFGGTIPWGGTAPGPGEIPSTGDGGCDPFFSTTTIHFRGHAPWGNISGLVLWCGNDIDTPKTFSVVEHV